MAPFTTRPIEGQQTLPERLAIRRRQFDLSAAAVCQTLKISSHYLEALEMGAYETLPGEVYIKHFLRRYAELLALPISETLEQFESEVMALGLRSKWRSLGPPRLRLSAMAWRIPLTIFLPTLAATAYFGIMLYRYTSPPPLTLTLPEGIVRQTRTIEVVGETLPSVQLFLNDIAVTKTPTGTFREALAVEPGIQTITLRAERRFSRPHIITRQLIVE